LPAGLRFLVVEGYRPPGLQRRYFENYAARLRAEQPGWSAEQIRSAASRFVSPPEIAPHSAGAAVDLTLADAEGRELISQQARTHRAILGRALMTEGFVNYPTEWWHWSFGDRYWALITGAGNACY
jgi:D-alanyl-D-alanine dipeptidase